MNRVGFWSALTCLRFQAVTCRRTPKMPSRNCSSSAVTRFEERLAFLIRREQDWDGRELRQRGKQYQGEDRLVVKQTHECAAEKPGDAIAGIEQAKRRAPFSRRDHVRQHRLKKRSLRAHPDAPQDHSNQRKNCRS